MSVEVTDYSAIYPIREYTSSKISLIIKPNPEHRILSTFPLIIPTMPALPSAYSNLEEYTKNLLIFISTPLARQITGGIHVNDALIQDAWGALPHEWTSWWDSLPNHRDAQLDLIDSISDPSLSSRLASPHELPLHESRPASLKTWLTTLSSLSLPRTPSSTMSNLSLPPHLTPKMSTKKTIEVATAAAYISAMCATSDITHIIDVGSGAGHLPLVLAAECHLRVLAIDGSAAQIASSRRSAALADINETQLAHLQRMVVGGDEELVTQIRAWADGHRCMIVGLHACGSLTEVLCRYFVELDFVDRVAVIGCCYNHVVPFSNACPNGFPISREMRDRDLVLAPTAMMVGCQDPENWNVLGEGRNDGSSGGSFDGPESGASRRRFYRAIMEKIFFDKGVQLNTDKRPVWGIRKGDLGSLQAFATRAMHCLGVPEDAVTKVEIAEYEQVYQGWQGRIAILWTLSVVLCKIVESVIALDRYYYLVESGAADVDIVPVFDYRVSPRNLMLVAGKGGQELSSSYVSVDT